METFLLVLAALFSVINPPGAALVFLSMTKYANSATRKSLARRVAMNSFFVMTGSLLIGALVLKLYGISVPVLRVAGGLIVAASGWKLLNEGTRSGADPAAAGQRTDYSGLAFYPLTLPLTTGPGTIAVMISLGLSRSAYSDYTADLGFFLASMLATMVIAAAIYTCFAYSDRVERLLGGSGTDIAVRLSAFILFCLGIQILWTGASDLLGSVQWHGKPAT
ncbi:MarC family protein [Bradyrhizobium lablabi]|uniref:MarC family protein n=1 Tax=Bradyrhizobium lablabi TaxID=722472 RepID=UPI001BA883B9|nr:MarC family protein [Bradyrhizobium lablabi]MBR0695530.1 NAAT family transporter [Bradyrhizobium lablabi]